MRVNVKETLEELKWYLEALDNSLRTTNVNASFAASVALREHCKVLADDIDRAFVKSLENAFLHNCREEARKRTK